jgi:glycosyltransferase involved in cell wall biosynthesis
LKVGIFHPPLDICGGAEWVAVNIINTLQKMGHETVVLTNTKINQTRMQSLLGQRVYANTEIVFPFELFPTTYLQNVYADILRIFLLRAKCDLVIDTQSNAILPRVSVTYLQGPPKRHELARKAMEGFPSNLKSSYYYPYYLYEKTQVKAQRLVFSNSKFTSDILKSGVGVTSEVLYPPISKDFFAEDFDPSAKENLVVSLSRISPEKQLSRIPKIAKLTRDGFRFLIIGVKESPEAMSDLVKSIDENGVSKKIEIVTNVPREKLITILAKAKVLLHTAQFEAFGVAIVEAMASGCIPIVHDSGGPREFVPESHRFNECREAARKIEKAFSKWTPTESKRMINLARLFSEGSFSENFMRKFNSYVNTKGK